jgi:hypothetical protein
MTIRMKICDIFVMLALYPFFGQVMSQPITAPTHISEMALPAKLNEHIALFTDKDIYVVESPVRFVAIYDLNLADGISGWSNIVYVELIKWNGEKVLQQKFELDPKGSHGKLTIPKELLSGNYYLRAYTQWMRNYTNADYAYKNIKIVNPYDPRLESGPDNNEGTTKGGQVVEKPSRAIVCKASQDVYQTRQTVEMELTLPQKHMDGPSHYYVSVARAGSLDTNFAWLNIPVSKQSPISRKIRFLPETRGLTVNGKVLGKLTKAPVENAQVILSIPLSGQYFSVFLTGKEGRFYFSLPPFYGKTDFYIEAVTTDSVETEILIDNDFCNEPVELPYLPFALTDSERKLVTDMAIGLQLQNKFYVNIDTLFLSSRKGYFYGKPENVYFMKKYIQLPNIGEFFFELVHEVELKYSKRQPYLKMAGNSSRSYLPPLILVDNIPVENNETLLKTPLAKFEKVEVIDQSYITTNKSYSGIVSLFSTNRDFAGIGFNKNSMFFSYGMLSPVDTYAANNFDHGDRHMPDNRDLLYWDPNLEFANEQTVKIKFKTSDAKGKYMAVIGGKGPNGTIIYGSCYFNVE